MLISKKEIFILSIPFINALVLIVVFFIEVEQAHFGHFRAIYMLIAISYFLFFFFRITTTDVTIYLFLGYLFLLLPLSSNLMVSFEAYLKVFISFMMFPLAYWFVNSSRRFKNVTNVYILSAGILIAMFIISQIFGIGTAVYTEESVLLTGDVYISNLLAYSALIFLFLFTTNIKRKYILIGLLILSAIIVLLVFRRSGILALLVGVVVIYFFTNKKYVYKKYLLISTLLLLLMSPFYIDQLIAESQFRTFETLANPEFGRTMDIKRAYNTITDLGILHTLTGIELFNYREFHNVRRNIHNDFAQILHGSGFIGLFLFLMVFISIWYSSYKKRGGIEKSDLKRNLYALSISLIAACLIISSANQLWVVSSLSYVMFYLGAIQGYMKSINESNNAFNESNYAYD